MIFVTVGSQKFQFDRLIKKIDELVGSNIISDQVIAQIGSSTYKPKNIKYYDFMDGMKFENLMKEAEIVITHGGTGVIVNASKLGKKIIAIPRLKKYGEHVDNHQVQIVRQFKEANLIEDIEDNIDELETKIQEVRQKEYKQYKSNTIEIINDIIEFIEE